MLTISFNVASQHNSGRSRQLLQRSPPAEFAAERDATGAGIPPWRDQSDPAAGDAVLHRLAATEHHGSPAAFAAGPVSDGAGCQCWHDRQQGQIHCRSTPTFVEFYHQVADHGEFASVRLHRATPGPRRC